MERLLTLLRIFANFAHNWRIFMSEVFPNKKVIQVWFKLEPVLNKIESNLKQCTFLVKRLERLSPFLVQCIQAILNNLNNIIQDNQAVLGNLNIIFKDIQTNLNQFAQKIKKHGKILLFSMMRSRFCWTTCMNLLWNKNDVKIVL